MKSRNTPVYYIRCDNSGENNFLKTKTRQKGWDISFEFTAPGTPQHNGHVERKFSTLYEYMRSLLNQTKLPTHIKQQLWAEAAYHATDRINIICTPANKKPPFTQFYGQDATYFKHLHKFGELTVVANMHKQLKSKTEDRCYMAIYLGRAIDHSDDTHCFLNLRTNRVILNRNTKFLNLMCSDYFSNNQNKNNRYSALMIDDDEDDGNLFTPPNSPATLNINYNQQVSTNQTTIAPTTHHNTRSKTAKALPTPPTADDDDILPDLVTDNTIATTTPTPTTDYFDELDETFPENYVPIAARIAPVDKSSKLFREMRSLNGFFNPTATNMLTSTTAPTPTDPSPPTLPTVPMTPTIDTTPIVHVSTHTADAVVPTAAVPTATCVPDAPALVDKALLMVHPIPRDRFFSVVTESKPFNVPLSQLKDILLTPTTFDEAFFHSDHWFRKRWRDAIKLELDKMHSHNVWVIVDKHSIPSNRKPIKNKWVFDIKRNGIFRARLVACGYSQIPGIHFQDSYSPVVNDVVFA
jgi:Reverse transcriptase (RNA-dependent DNA polymerase)